MAEKLRLFVSATADLSSERGVIGRAIADLPTQIGIEIRRTPVEGASYDDVFELVANVDRVYFLLGADITAPSGAEWYLSWKLERSLMPLRNLARRSPAAQEFLRTSLVEWTIFRSSTDLYRLVTLDLVRMLNHPTNRYGLSVTDLELLNLHGRRVKAQTPSPQKSSADIEPGGAEGGGVLLDTAHHEPEDGMLLED